jgi:cytochrome P450
MTETDPARAEDRADSSSLSLLMAEMSAPQEAYRRLIDAGGVTGPAEGFVQVFDRRLNDYVLRHHELFSSALGLDLGNVRPLIPLNIDPPQHSKYRKILDPLFAPKVMDRQEEDIAARVNHFIDAFVDRGGCNFTEEFAELFPSSVFLGLMGFPWSELDTLMRLRDGVLHKEKIDPDTRFDPEKRAALGRANGREIYAYFDAWLDERQARPRQDILTHFLEAEVDGERLSREEILDICFLFLVAGLDTVSDSLTCFWAFLARHDGHRQQIVDDPSIIPAAVEELLRWETPVPIGTPRVATSDAALPNGTEVPSGCPVLVTYGAANVDPSEFEDPFEVRFDRVANRHIAFGAGVHRCLGSHLARRELRIAVREWHRRIPDYRIAPGHEQLEYPPGLRHVKDLTLTWT